MRDPTVSVVIPTYNRAHLVCRAIRSVLAQSYSDFELLIIDDCSQDGTEDAVRSIDDPRIRYFRSEANFGVSHSRNVGIRLSRGEYVAFLDDDDEYMTDFLRETTGVLAEAPLTVGCTWCGIRRVEVTAEGERIVEEDLWNPSPSRESFRSYFVHRRFGTNRGFTVRRSAFDEVGLFNEALRTAEDAEFFFRIVAVKEFRVIPKILIRCHIHGGPRLNVRSLARAEAYALITKSNQAYLRHWPRERCHMHAVTAKLFYAAAAHRRARRHVVHAIASWPFYPKLWAMVFRFEVMQPLRLVRRKQPPRTYSPARGEKRIDSTITPG